MKRPAWAAAPTFPQAWAAIESHPDANEDWRRLMLRQLVAARVVSVAPEQIKALPYLRALGTPGEGKGQRNYDVLAEELAALRLPFDPLYCDLGGVGFPDYPESESATILGALAISEPGTGVVNVAPLVTHMNRFAIRMDYAIAPDGHGGINIGKPPHSYLEALQKRKPDLVTGLHEAIMDAAERAVALLRWLESVNVDLVEAPLSPRQRTRELKKGRQIALTVQVRPPKSKPVGRNGTANYSHRFEVRGHYMHFPEGTKVGDADPQKLSFVPGRGFVRKVWCPPHVKGPEDKPLIPKVRVVEDGRAAA